MVHMVSHNHVSHYHLAQINIARMAAPLDSPVMEQFVAQLATINALAELSPGFVWRLQTESGDATSLRAFDDPLVLVNMSVWESVEALREFTYKTGHVGVLRDRMKWFEKPRAAHLAMWWIPAGHVPTVEEAKSRLEYLQSHGETAFAFSFSNPHPAPAVQTA
jgi:hypothetical protein